MTRKSHKVADGPAGEGRVVPFPGSAPRMRHRPPVADPRVVYLERVATAVLSLADQLRGWNSEIEFTAFRPGLAEAAARMAAALDAISFEVTPSALTLIEALRELAAGHSDFADEPRRAAGGSR